MNIENKRVGKFGFYGEWPDEIMTDVIKYFKNVEWLIPAWCHVCVLSWDESETHALLKVSVDSEYRRIYITVSPKWLSLDKEEKINSTRHEMIHGFNTLISDYCMDEFDRILEDQPLLRESIADQIKLRVEQATCDLEYCLSQVNITPKSAKEKG